MKTPEYLDRKPWQKALQWPRIVVLYVVIYTNSGFETGVEGLATEKRKERKDLQGTIFLRSQLTSAPSFCVRRGGVVLPLSHCDRNDSLTLKSGHSKCGKFV